jgi:hypothetical protein
MVRGYLFKNIEELADKNKVTHRRVACAKSFVGKIPEDLPNPDIRFDSRSYYIEWFVDSDNSVLVKLSQDRATYTSVVKGKSSEDSCNVRQGNTDLIFVSVRRIVG